MYPGYGPYEVTLIAHGCNGAADTLVFEVNPSKHSDPTIITNGDGYFSIFPNPVIAGKLIYVYLNGLDPKNGDVFLAIHSGNGEYVQRIYLTAKEGTYLIDQSLSAGLYFLSLYQGDELLQSRKLMVE